MEWEVFILINMVLELTTPEVIMLITFITIKITYSQVITTPMLVKLMHINIVIKLKIKNIQR